MKNKKWGRIMANKLQEIESNAVTTKQHDFFTEIPYEDYEWLIEQAKKVERYEKVMNEAIEECKGRSARVVILLRKELER